jgi:hypothetical protein
VVGIVCVADLSQSIGEQEEGDLDALLMRWDTPAHSEGEGHLGHPSLAVVPSASVFVGSWFSSFAEQGFLRMFDWRQAAPAASVKCPAIADLFSPPNSSMPMCIAALTTGETRVLDLRMLGCTSPDLWPVVIDAQPSDSGSVHLPKLSGDGHTLLATRPGGVLLGAFCERRLDTIESAKLTVRPAHKDRKKKSSLRGEAVNEGKRRYPKKNNRRKQ